MLLHVVLADDNIQRVRIERLPEKVDDLKILLKTCLNLEDEIVIQFQDEEFGDCTVDTGSLDTSSQSSGKTSGRSKPWLNLFIIPTFSYDIELKLRKGNDTYQKDGSLLHLTSDIKTDILNKKQIEDVAKALVEKHPCLKEPGSKEGFYCWKFSLGFKMGNLRQKYCIAGCPELAVNRKRSEGQEK
uniref:Uncharacterized protein n=1 Tax=Nothobranchius furzeri TaxID=105023 RepID=A0A1A7ZL63_NOTFU